MAGLTWERMARARISSVPFVLFTALSTNLRAQGLDTTDYVPLRVGNTYTYYQSLPCPPDTVRQRIGPWTTHRIVDTTIIDGKKYFMSEGSSDMVRIDSMNNLIVRRSGVEQVYYRLNAGVGESWSYTRTAGDQEYVYNVTMQSRTDTVRVHAGTFTRCLRIYFDIPASIDDEYTVWLAPNVGTVFQCSWEPLELYEATLNGIHYPGITSVSEERNPIAAFALYQNYPNPFNPETFIKYELRTSARVKLTVFDIEGRCVKKLVDDLLRPGVYEVQWDGRTVDGKKSASGTYIYQIIANDHQLSKKLQLLK
jgi:hypothetical protein